MLSNSCLIEVQILIRQINMARLHYIALCNSVAKMRSNYSLIKDQIQTSLTVMAGLLYLLHTEWATRIS